MPAQTDALSNIYARSLYELAHTAGGESKIAEVSSELEQICELLRSDRKFAEFLASPIVDRDSRGESLRRIFSNRVTDLTLRFLLVLNGNGRLGHLESISAALDRMEQEIYGRVEVDTFTPSPLTPDQLKNLKQRIHNALGKEPVIHPYTDATMLGGIKLRIGDQLIDGSVAGRLRRMKHSIHNTGGSQIRNRFKKCFNTEITEGHGDE